MRKRIILGASLLVLAVACKENQKKTENDSEKSVEVESVMSNAAEKSIVVNLEPKGDSKAEGTVTFTESEGIVYMNFEGKGFTPGTHAIHLHEKADCSSADGKSTGGHWNPTFEDHGKWGVPPYHKGDIGNFEADENGNATLNFETDQWCIGCDDDTKNIVGKAIIIHDGADDFVSQPSGDAGSRVSCGAIIE